MDSSLDDNIRKLLEEDFKKWFERGINTAAPVEVLRMGDFDCQH